MTRYAVRILPSAYPDIEEAFLWIASQAPEAAERWRDGFFEAIDGLSVFPERNPLAAEAKQHKRKLRQLLYGDRRGTYRILYEVVGLEARVLHVRHGARTPLGADEY